jgi:hypothetical protein
MKRYLFFEYLMKEEVDGTIWHIGEREIHNKGVFGRREIRKERWYEIDERTREVSDGGRNRWEVWVEMAKEVWELIVKRKTCA